MECIASFLAMTMVRSSTPNNATYIKFFTAADSSRDLASSSPFAAATQQQPGQAQDYNKLFKAEKDNLELAEGLYSWACKDVEVRVLRRYGKLPIEATKR